MPKVPRKNISSRLADIKVPGIRRSNPKLASATELVKPLPDALRDSPPVSSSPPDALCVPYHSHRQAKVFLLVGISLIALVVLLTGIYRAQWRSFRSVASARFHLETAVENARGFNFAGVEENLETARGALENRSNNDGSEFYLSSLGDYFSRFLPIFKNTGALISGLQNITSLSLEVTQKSIALAQNAPEYLFKQHGDGLINGLKEIQELLRETKRQSEQMVLAAGSFKDILPSNFAGFYLPLLSELTRADNFLDALIVWLSPPAERHLVIFLQNPSELRPGGGFLGSFAEVTLQGGSIRDIKFRDINEADRELSLNIVPPRPLQALVSRWRAADANWFFNFPDSAAAVLRLLEASELYRGKGIVFDGAIALSPRVIQDILTITGPVNLSQAKLTLTGETFLQDIQLRVQQGQEQKSTYPKKVLQEALPAIIDRMQTLSPEQKQALFDSARRWITDKDIMFYFKDATFQNFLDTYAWTGAVFPLAENFNGDYLAVVNANVGGGKTDLFMKQQIEAHIQLNEDGTVSDHLVIHRAHRGNQSSRWWYRVQNREYLQIFTPPGAQLKNISGEWQRTVRPQMSYRNSGYITDNTLVATENAASDFLSFPTVRSLAAAGKNIFGFWSRVDVGRKVDITLDYTRRSFLPPQEGRVYQFILEKQSGNQSEYKIEISTPVGYRWREKKFPVYTAEFSPLPGRVIISLTLEKI